MPTSSSAHHPTGNKQVLFDRIKSWLVDLIVKNMPIVRNMFIVKNMLIVKSMLCMVIFKNMLIRSPHWRRPKLR